MIELKIEDLTVEGAGIGRYLGQAVFVPGVLPEELVRAKVIKMTKNYAVARLEEILERSPYRVERACAAKRCGGCNLLHLSYEAQLRYKTAYVKGCFERIAKIEADVKDCRPSPTQIAYRNKCAFPVGKGGIGFYAPRSHDIIDVDECPIQCREINDTFRAVKRIVSDMSFYDEQTGTGTLRHIIIRKVKSGMGVTLVVNAQGIREYIVSHIAQLPGVINVSVNVNTNNTNVILGDETKAVFESALLLEDFLGLMFEVSPNSFMQVNSEQAEHLYECAIEFADISEEDTVADLFCGVGTLTLLAAKRAKRALGVEILPEAIENARQNAKRNGIDNAVFYCGDACDERALTGSDIVLLDPPRRGCDERTLNAIAAASPKRIVYISCDAATLARDCAYLAAKGYEVKTVHPFDMFPQTTHVECVVLMSRVKVLNLLG